MQYINFYTAKEAQFSGVSLQLILKVIALSLGCMASVNVWQYCQSSQIANNLVMTNTKLLNTQAELSKQIILQNKKKDLKLDQQLEKSQKALSQSQELLTKINALEQQAKPYGLILEALAEQAVPELWFTRFSINQHGLLYNFEGKTLKAESIPLLINNFSKTQILQDLKFDVLKLEELSPNQAYSFLLKSKS